MVDGKFFATQFYPDVEGGVISLPLSHKRRTKVASPELRDHSRPQTPDFRGLFIDGGLHHDQLRGRINEDALPEVPQERELPSAAGKQVDLIAVPEPSLGLCQIRFGGAHRSRINHPLCRYNLFALPRSVVGQQTSKPRVVAQYRIEEPVRYLIAFRINQPFGMASVPIGCQTFSWR